MVAVLTVGTPLSGRLVDARPVIGMDTEASDANRRRLLPRSGVGVVSPWLVIAPAGHPLTRLDVRLLDSVEIRSMDDDDDEADDEESEDDRLSEVLLTCRDLRVAVYIADGPEAAARIVDECAPLTRPKASAERAQGETVRL